MNVLGDSIGCAIVQANVELESLEEEDDYESEDNEDNDYEEHNI